MGELLIKNLQRESGFDAFYFLVAYSRSGGAGLLSGPISRFRDSGGIVRAIVGIDQGNTSVEGLRTLLQCCDEVYVYDDIQVSRTFHPKLYVFEKTGHLAEVIIGSCNLTYGGLVSNYELAWVARFDLANPEQLGEYKKVVSVFELFSDTESECCKRLNELLLAELHSLGYVKFESTMRKREAPPMRRRTGEARIFGTSGIPLRGLSLKPPRVQVPISSATMARVERPEVFWKVAPGKSGKQWHLWERHIGPDLKGVAAIGWPLDLTRLPFEEPAEALRRVKEELRKANADSRPGSVLRQARQFCREIKRDHVIVAYSKEQIYGIARVSDDDPYYVKVADQENELYSTRREVRWIATPYQRPLKRFMRHLRTNDTVHPITDPGTIEMLLGLMKERTVHRIYGRKRLEHDETRYRCYIGDITTPDIPKQSFLEAHGLGTFRRVAYTRDASGEITGLVFHGYRNRIDAELKKPRNEFWWSTSRPINVDGLRETIPVFVLETNYDNDKHERVEKPKLRIQGKLTKICKVRGPRMEQLLP